jgi:hypothetical protein
MPPVALIGAFLLTTNPVYFNLANTFMTDVPFVCLTLLAMGLMIRGVHDDAPGWLFAGIFCALVSVFLRQVGIVTLIGSGLAYLIKRGVSSANFIRAAAPTVVGLALHIAFQRWLITTGRARELLAPSIGELIPHSIADFISHSARNTMHSLPYIGIFMLPFTLTVRGAEIFRTTRKQTAFLNLGLAVIATLLAIWLVTTRNSLPNLGNVVDSTGGGTVTLQGVHHAWEPMQRVWLIGTVLSAIGLVLLAEKTIKAAVFAFKRAIRQSDRPWLPVFLIWFLTAYSGLVLILVYWHRNEMYDRYLLPLLPCFMMLLVWADANGARPFMMSSLLIGLAAIIVALQGLFALFTTHDYLGWNRSRWQALDYLMDQRHVPPSQIDGGYEANGWLYNSLHSGHREGESYWWNGSANYVIAVGPVVGYTEIARFPTNRWLQSMPADILALQKD